MCCVLSRSLGDLTAATVGCTSDPEVSYTTLRPGVDHVLVMATDGVWDVLTNEQVRFQYRSRSSLPLIVPVRSVQPM